MCRPTVPFAAPFVPSDDGEVLERLPLSPLEPAARQVQDAREQLARRPGNLALAARLAWLYIEQGRQLSDPRYYGYAQAALTPWWSQDEPPVQVLVLRATLRQHDHDFVGASSDLARALRLDPWNAQAWLTRAIVSQVRGDYADARQSCQEVLQLSTPLVAATCLSSVESLNGGAEAGYRMLTGALARAGAADTAGQVWALTTLAEMAVRSGRAREAEAHFRRALALAPPDAYLLGDYADFLLDEGRPEAVRDLLRDETRVDALLLRLALAEKALSAPEVGQHVQMLRERFAAARLRGDTVHRREEARFALGLLDQPEVALSLARDNWQVQREPWDARLLLEAALAAGQAAAAQPVLEFMAQTGLEDAAAKRLAEQLGAGRSS